jgi:hypothetical protein
VGCSQFQCMCVSSHGRGPFGRLFDWYGGPPIETETMPAVTTHKRIYLGASHHRQPRNPTPWVEPYAAEVDSNAFGSVSRLAQPTLPYTPAGGVKVDATFAFWSASDKAGGSTQQNHALSASVGADDLTLVAWYFLPSSGPGRGTGMLIDAYSVAASDFVDEDFVTVTSDPSLTSQANIAGFVPTATAQTVAAFPALSGGESFEHWLVTSDAASASGAVLSTPAKSGGLAFATYRHAPPVSIPVADVTEPLLAGTILYGIIEGGDGVIFIGGRPVHIGPHGPLIGKLLVLVGVYTAAGTLPERSAGEIRRVLARDIGEVAGEIGQLAEKLGG